MIGRDAAQLYLFGSVARGDARPSSDIDIAIEAREPMPEALLATLRERLEDSNIPYTVDIVDLARANPDMQRRIRREGIPWTD